MAKRNRKVLKLRAYRDKLLGKITNDEGIIRSYQASLREIRKALQQEDTLRAYALASEEPPHPQLTEFNEKNEIVKELTLVYRFLAVERNYTDQITRAAAHRDYLRVAALVADHKAEQVAHDRMLESWSEDHGFTRSLRDEANQVIV